MASNAPLSLNRVGILHEAEASVVGSGERTTSGIEPMQFVGDHPLESLRTSRPRCRGTLQERRIRKADVVSPSAPNRTDPYMPGREHPVSLRVPSLTGRAIGHFLSAHNPV